MRWTNRRRRLPPPDNLIGGRPALGTRIRAAPRTAPPNFWMAPPCPLGFPALETRWIPGVVGPRSPKATRLIRRCSARRSGLPLTETRCVFSLKKADGVGFEPTSDFRRCRFSRPVHSTALPPIPCPDRTRQPDHDRITTTLATPAPEEGPPADEPPMDAADGRRRPPNELPTAPHGPAADTRRFLGRTGRHDASTPLGPRKSTNRARPTPSTAQGQGPGAGRPQHSALRLLSCWLRITSSMTVFHWRAR